jgi:hypothetical protein
MDDEELEYHDESEDYRECDICGENDTKIQCPQCWYDLEEKGTIEKYVCENCCKEILFSDNEYLSDGCIGDCNTGRPEEFFKERLKELAAKNKLNESTKYNGNFFNTSKTVLFGNCTITKNSYPPFIDENVLKIPVAIYSGEYATFIKTDSEEIKAYDIEWIQEVKNLFKEMKEKWEEVEFYSHKDTLLIRGYFNFALIQESNNIKDLLERETPVFENSILNGIEFFNIHLQKPINISFERLTPDDFELFSVDLLKSLSFKNIKRIGGTSGDDGIDIFATEEIKTFDGVEDRTWQVQCKRISDNLNFDDVAKEQLRACAHGVYGLLYILSSDFTSPTKRQIKDYNEDTKNPIQIKYFNRYDIENFLLQKSELLKKWIYKI